MARLLPLLELASGIAAGLVGIFGWSYAVFGPTYHWCTSSAITAVAPSGASSAPDQTASTAATCYTANAAQIGLDPRAISFLTVVLLCFVGVAAGSCLHAWRGWTNGIWLIFGCALVLTALSFLSALSVGTFFLPATLLAWLTFTLGLRNREPKPHWSRH